MRHKRYWRGLQQARFVRYPETRRQPQRDFRRATTRLHILLDAESGIGTILPGSAGFHGERIGEMGTASLTVALDGSSLCDTYTSRVPLSETIASAPRNEPGDTSDPRCTSAAQSRELTHRLQGVRCVVLTAAAAKLGTCET